MTNKTTAAHHLTAHTPGPGAQTIYTMAHEMNAEIAELRAERDSLKQQRDELAAALGSLLAVVTESPTDQREWDAARAALAKVRS